MRNRSDASAGCPPKPCSQDASAGLPIDFPKAHIQDGRNVKSELPAVIDSDQQPQELEVKLTGAQRKKHNRAAREAAAFARYGVQVLRMKATTLAVLGKHAEQAGIKQIGHGRVILASENAEMCIQTLGGLVQDLAKAKPCPDHAVILDIMRLLRDFNDQLISTAAMHIAADKQPSMEPAADRATLPPPGATVMIAIGKENGFKSQ